MKIREAVDQFRQRLQRLLHSPTEEMGRGGRFLVYQVRLGLFCGRKLVKDRLQVTASALSYKTILSLIPVLILFWMMVNALVPEGDIRQGIRNTIFEALRLSDIGTTSDITGPRVGESQFMTSEGQAVDAGESNTLRDAITRMIDRQVSGIQSGGAPITIISVVLFVWMGMSIFKTVEGAFNYIWEVRRGRGHFARLRDFITSLVVLALVLGLAVTWQRHYGGLIVGGVGVLVPLLAAWVVFFVVYKTMPTTHVNTRAAFAAAVVAGTIWELGAKTGLMFYLKYATGAQRLYGNLALIPVLMLWIWISWIIVLFGAELAYAIQYMKSLTRELFDADHRGRFLRADLAGLAVSTEIARRFDGGGEPPTRRELAEAVAASEGDVDEILRLLQDAGLLRPAERSDGERGWQPARPLEQISAAEVIEAASGAEFRPSEHRGARGHMLVWARQHVRQVAGDAAEKLAGETLASLARSDDGR